MEILATVGSAAGSKLEDLGVQLALLAGIALFLGSLRLILAKRTRQRVLLAVGLLLFAVGFALQSMERLEVMQLDYYPGWKADMDRIFLEEDPDLEFSEDDMDVELGEPAWWEGVVWWGQRIARVLGLGLAITGFVFDGRWLLQQGQGRKAKTKPTRKRAARS
jgi:hypothetical protein